MFFAVIFEMFIAIMNEKIPEIIIVARIYDKFVRVSVGRSLFIATAAPVRVLFIE